MLDEKFYHHYIEMDGISGYLLDGRNALKTNLQDAYNETSPAIIYLNQSNGPFIIRDGKTPVAGNLFEVRSNDGSQLYFSVDTSGAVIPPGPLSGPTVTLTNTSNQIILGTGTTTTLSAPTPAANAILSLPTSTDTLVGRATADTFTNKILSAGQINSDSFIADATNTSKNLYFDLSGATPLTRSTLVFNQGVNATISFPAANTTLVGRDTADTLTNKTLTSAILNGDSSIGTLQSNTTMTGGVLNVGTNGISPPTVAISIASGTGGVMSAGVYTYKYTYYTNTTETSLSPISPILTNNTTGLSATLTFTDSPEAAVGIRIYKTKASTPGTYYLLVDIPNNTTTSYIDNTVPDTSLTTVYTGSHSLTTNNINGAINLHGPDLAINAYSQRNTYIGSDALANPIAFSATIVASGSGTVFAGSSTYKYQISYFTNDGETAATTIGSFNTLEATATLNLTLPNQVGVRTLGINVFRTLASGATFYYVGTMGPLDIVFQDNTPDSVISLNRTAPTVNTTLSTTTYLAGNQISNSFQLSSGGTPLTTYQEGTLLMNYKMSGQIVVSSLNHKWIIQNGIAKIYVPSVNRAFQSTSGAVTSDVLPVNLRPNATYYAEGGPGISVFAGDDAGTLFARAVIDVSGGTNQIYVESIPTGSWPATTTMLWDGFVLEYLL